MHFFVAGATGRTGTAFVTAASAAGHSVTAFVRNPAKAASLPATLVEGDVLDRASIERALTSEHVIVSTLGGGSPMAPGTSVGIGTANLVAAATERGAKRILAVVGAGVLQADPQRLRNELPDYPKFLLKVTGEHSNVYRALRESTLEWTLACCPDIADGPATGALVAKADYLPDGGGRITTGDIAAFLLREAEAREHVRSRVGLNAPR